MNIRYRVTLSVDERAELAAMVQGGHPALVEATPSAW